jgi:hypothetical protein
MNDIQMLRVCEGQGILTDLDKTASIAFEKKHHASCGRRRLGHGAYDIALT